MTSAENIRIGLDALLAQKMRTLLTMLGIIFGVAAVVAMQSIGAGAKKELLEAIRLLGVNNVIVRTTELKGEELKQAVTKNPKQLHDGDVRALREVLTGVKYVIPVRRDEVFVRFPDDEKIKLVGTTPEYPFAQPLDLVEGRFLVPSDMETKMPVAVLAETLKRKLFPLEDATGKRVKIWKTWFAVVGVVRPPSDGKDVRGLDKQDMDADIFIPLGAMQARVPLTAEKSPLQEIILQVENEKMVRATAATAERIIRRRHRNAEDSQVIVPIELLKQSQQTQRIFNIVMGAIASISLLVGGIGIMNIMLSNVLERTREIGVRRAVGATRADVTTQFLIEAVLLSVIGGIIGIGLGALMAWLITLYAEWTTVVGAGAVLLAFGVSAGVGILFGWWPAKKAAEMNVINALRYE